MRRCLKTKKSEGKLLSVNQGNMINICSPRFKGMSVDGFMNGGFLNGDMEV